MGHKINRWLSSSPVCAVILAHRFPIRQPNQFGQTNFGVLRDGEANGRSAPVSAAATCRQDLTAQPRAVARRDFL